jgi:hypothetical protein
MYARSNMAEHAGDMMDGAVANYGKLLQSGAHIGGVMPNYYSGTLDRLSRGWRNYLADDHAMLYNASQRDYSYGASRLANAMQRNSALLSTAFDLYDRGRKYSMPGWRGYEYPSYQAYTVEEDLL